jgi:predicted nucleotide-binding protein
MWLDGDLGSARRPATSHNAQMPVPAPTDDRIRRLVNTTFELFFRTSRWPTFEELDRQLDRQGDPDAFGALQAASVGLIYGIGAGAAPPQDDHPIALTLAGLMACKAAAEDVSAFVSAVALACELADAAPLDAEEVSLGSSDVSKRLLIAAGKDALLERLFHILSVEPWGAKGSHRQVDSGTWKFIIHPRQVRRLRGATTAAECWHRMHGDRKELTFDHASIMPNVEDDISRNVWVVHGRDLAQRDAMFDFLRSLDLNPMEFSDVAIKTGVGAPYVGQILDTAFKQANAVVVLLTPDEVAYLRPEFAERDNEIAPGHQARPNVLFEAGMAFGHHPDRTILVEMGDLRPFSDIAGRHAIRLNGQIAPLNELAGRLQAAGCPINRNGTDWTRLDRFRTPPATSLALGRKVPSESSSGPRLGIKLAFYPSGKSGRLHVKNVGDKTLFDIVLTLPPEVGVFHVIQDGPIPKIPAGETVRLPAFAIKAYGGNGPSSFDVSVVARTDDGAEFRDEIFLDIGG